MEVFDLDTALPVYIDFLATFEIGQDGIFDTPDAMKQLVERGVQPRRFVSGAEMSFTKDEIVIRGPSSNSIIKSFDLKRVADPVAFTRKVNSTDGFSRVVIFRELKSGHFNYNDVFHAVQCVDSSPVELVELLNHLKDSIGRDGKELQSGNDNSYDRQVSNRSQTSLDVNWFNESNPVRNFNIGNNGTDSVRSATISRRNFGRSRASAIFGPEPSSVGVIAVPAPTAPTTFQAQTPPQHTRSKRSDNPLPLVIDPVRTAETLGFERPNFVYSTSEDPLKKDSILLNYCIGDIEHFKEQVEATKAKRIQHEFQASDFFNIFQKFKLAFNLLGELDGHIENPSAETILHHLFPPLAFLVDECYDLFVEFVVREVVTPLPTAKAIDMLQRYLSQNEQTVWRALGDYWLNPRSDWDGEIAPYSPRFHDGWSPGVISFFDDKQPQHESDKNEDTRSYRGSISSMNQSATHDAFRDELIDRNAAIALAVHGWEAQNEKELSIGRGEYLEILDSSRQWWQVVNYIGESGYVPCTILKKMKFEDAKPEREEIPLRQPVRKASSKKEKRRSRRQSVSSESSFLPDEEEEPPRSTYAPPPPPPPPPQPTVYTTASKSQHRPKKFNSRDTVRSVMSVQEELKSVLEIINKSEKHLEIVKTPEVYITPSSTPKEVQKWLKVKQFGQRVHDELFGFDGKKLFAMSREDFIAAFGKKEGTRLDSQITISRNRAGYTTGKSSELRKVLQKHRERIEKEKAEGSSDSDEEEEKQASKV